MAFTPPKKERLTGILAIGVYLAAGLLLLIRPDIMGELTRWTLTVVLAVYGVYQAIRYFRTPALEAAMGYRLTAALIAGTLALLAWINPSLLTYRLWGVLILCGGYMKFQTAWDFFRLGHRRWWWIMIGAAVSLLLGVLVVTEVISANVTLWLGLALLAEAVLDTAVQIMIAKGDKWNTEPKPEQKKEAPAQEEPAAAPAADETPAAEEPAAAPETPAPEAEESAPAEPQTAAEA